MSTLYDGKGNVIKLNDNILNGKKVLPIGDSITTSSGYRDVLQSVYGISEIAGGYAGGRQIGYASGSTNCILEHLDEIADGKPDIGYIHLGTNDYGNNAPIGEITDDSSSQTESNYTFIGCYKKLIESLYEKYGHFPIVLITPFPRNGGRNKNTADYTLEDYSNAIKKVADYYSLEVCDMFSNCGIPIGTLTDYSNDTYFYTSDGLHLMRNACAIAVPKIAESMMSAIKKDVVLCSSLGSSGEQYTLTSTEPQRIYILLNPSGTTERVEWTSSNETIVKVTPNINYIYADIVAVSNGSATITATCGNVKKNFSITVSM